MNFKKRAGFWLFEYGWKFAVIVLSVVFVIAAIIIFAVWPSTGTCVWNNYQQGVQIAGKC